MIPRKGCLLALMLILPRVAPWGKGNVLNSYTFALINIRYDSQLSRPYDVVVVV